MASLTKKSIFNLSKAFPNRASSVFIGRQIWKGGYVATEESSEPPQRRHERNYGSSETGGKVSEMADKAKEVKDKAKETAQDAWKAIEDTAEEMKGKVVGDVDPENVQDEIMVEDEKELRKKLAKEPGGKPVDEDKGVDLNWRPIVEKKPQAS
ncbi:uncharacterized protein LOC107827569 [Nicotiana tabacum]|uniref:Uncharacterized protein LOC107827569 n=1 Tax=Nicotiana tabacum TaxID=4097 RepID=A0A1S4D9Z3_TOBAC|nr:uncharacterized protein LOC104099145 [Nicotiana tomentosiformis]XP_016510211.1 PREDICTED: uncharacterized protein LOC107827569 [Nicotiana tabacum]